MKNVEMLASKLDGVSHTMAIAGQSILMNANAPNFGAMYVMLDEFHHRAQHGLSGPAIAARAAEQAARRDQGRAGQRLRRASGRRAGHRRRIQDRGAGPRRPGLERDRGTSPTGSSTNLDRRKTRSCFRGSSPAFAPIRRGSTSTSTATRPSWRGFRSPSCSTRFRSTWARSTSTTSTGSGAPGRSTCRATANFRKQMNDLTGLRVRNRRGGMVPLGSVAKIRDVSGPVMLIRYNLYPSATINLNAAPGVSSGQAIDAMERLVEPKLPQAMRSEWTELALLQQQTGSTAMFAFTLAVVLVFLVLAAQYESWSLPLAVILVVPMCLLCSTVGVNIARMDINIFTQVGFIVLVGLACKNAILIVEFAKKQRESGSTREDATLEACELRLRPIMMTSLAFILGVVPLVLSAGRRGGNAANPGHGRLQRHAGRDAVRDLPDAGLLLRDPVVERQARRAPDRPTSWKRNPPDDGAGEPEPRLRAVPANGDGDLLNRPATAPSTPPRMPLH